MAFEKSTGKVVWTTPNPKAGRAGLIQSPVPMTLGGREMILAAGAQDYLIGVEARTGANDSGNAMVLPRKGCLAPRPCLSGTGAFL